MNLEVLDLIYKFLMKVHLKGEEVASFNICIKAIIDEVEKIKKEKVNKPACP